MSDAKHYMKTLVKVSYMDCISAGAGPRNYQIFSGLIDAAVKVKQAMAARTKEEPSRRWFF